MKTMDIQALREEFPVTEKWVYIDHAGVAPISRRVQRAMQSQLRNVVQYGIVQSDEWESAYARTRRSTAHLIGARPSEIAFVENTTEGIHIVANGLNWRRGDNVVISQRGFPANVYPWLNLATRGVETQFAHEQKGRIPIENIFEQVDECTRLISISSVKTPQGYRHDLPEIGAFCKGRHPVFCRRHSKFGHTSRRRKSRNSFSIGQCTQVAVGPGRSRVSSFVHAVQCAT